MNKTRMLLHENANTCLMIKHKDIKIRLVACLLVAALWQMLLQESMNARLYHVTKALLKLHNRWNIAWLVKSSWLHKPVCYININRCLQALANFNEYREIHIRTPRSNSSDFMKIQIGFAEENDVKKILFEITFEDSNGGALVTGKARWVQRVELKFNSHHMTLPYDQLVWWL